MRRGEGRSGKNKHRSRNQGSELHVDDVEGDFFFWNERMQRFTSLWSIAVLVAEGLENTYRLVRSPLRTSDFATIATSNQTLCHMFVGISAALRTPGIKNV